MSTSPNIIATLVFFFTFIVFQSSYAQDSKAQKYSLNKCIEAGLLNNLNIITAENSVITAESQKMQSYGNYIPTLNGSVQWSRSDQDQLITRNANQIISRDRYSASLSSNLTLFDGLGTIATIQQSISGLKSSELSLARTKQDITFEVQSSYYNVLRNKQLLTTAQENLVRSTKQLERIQEQNRVGSVALADVYRQQVQVGRDELSVIQSENDVKNSLADLTFLIGIKTSDEFDVEEQAVEAVTDSIAIKDFRNKVMNYDRSVQQAIQIRPDYQNVIESKYSAEKGVTIARSGYYPSLSAFASYGWSDILLNDFINNRKNTDAFSYGLSLSIPILSNLRTSNAVQQALVAERNADENLKQMERQIRVQLRKALNQLETAEKNIETTKRNLFSTEEDLRIATERYNIGAGTLLDQVTANVGYITARSDKVNAIYNYLIARKQVEYYIGNNN